MRIVTTFILFFIIALSCAEEKLTLYNVPKDYRLWKKPVTKVLDYPVPGHGATFRVIYANDLSFKAKRSKDANYNERIDFPDGSIVIKEVYKKREDINLKEPQLTIMIKDTGNKDALDGWLYYVKNPKDKQAKLISGRMCIGCHEAANDKHPYFNGNPKGIFCDYIFVDIAK
jgi:hypothetical protein